jgi:hypothetical protein
MFWMLPLSEGMVLLGGDFPLNPASLASERFYTPGTGSALPDEADAEYDRRRYKEEL